MKTPPAIATGKGEYVLVDACLPGLPRRTIGIVLLDPRDDTAHVRFRRDLLEVAAPEDYEVLSLLAEDFRAKQTEWGGAGLLEFLEDSCSHALRITPRESVLLHRPVDTLDRLYGRHIEATVLPYDTHLPVWSLRPAAGGFSPDQHVQEQGWREMPESLHLREGMFVAQVAGRSMEPLIHDGEDCVFRRGVAGSRQGRVVLVALHDGDGIGQYTVKRWRSRKQQDPSSGWRHEHVTLEPLNPEFQPLEFNLADYPEGSPFEVIAEFVAVL